MVLILKRIPIPHSQTQTHFRFCWSYPIPTLLSSRTWTGKAGVDSTAGSTVWAGCVGWMVLGNGWRRHTEAIFLIFVLHLTYSDLRLAPTESMETIDLVCVWNSYSFFWTDLPFPVECLGSSWFFPLQVALGRITWRHTEGTSRGTPSQAMAGRFWWSPCLHLRVKRESMVGFLLQYGCTMLQSMIQGLCDLMLGELKTLWNNMNNFCEHPPSPYWDVLAVGPGLANPMQA